MTRITPATTTTATCHQNMEYEHNSNYSSNNNNKLNDNNNSNSNNNFCKEQQRQQQWQQHPPQHWQWKKKQQQTCKENWKAYVREADLWKMLKNSTAGVKLINYYLEWTEISSFSQHFLAWCKQFLLISTTVYTICVTLIWHRPSDRFPFCKLRSLLSDISWRWQE